MDMYYNWIEIVVVNNNEKFYELLSNVQNFPPEKGKKTDEIESSDAYWNTENFHKIR